MAALLLALSAALPAAAQPASGPVGLWRTVDDRTGRERGLVRIYERDGILNGRIEQVFDPAEARRTCDRCEGDRRGAPAIGLEFLRGLRPDGSGGWDHGEVLDPETGNVYRGSVRLGEGGRTLVLRGSVLGGLIGRSQTWVRQQ